MQHKVCKMCGRELEDLHYYRSHNWVRYPDGRLDVCRDCISTKIKNYHGRYPLGQYLTVLKEADVPFLEKEWKYREERLKESHGANYPPEALLGRYLAMMNLYGYQEYRYEDTQKLNDHPEIIKALNEGIPVEEQVHIKKYIEEHRNDKFQGGTNCIVLASGSRLPAFESAYPHFVCYRRSKDGRDNRYINPRTEEHWQTIVASENCKGFRYSRVIIDSTMDYDLYREVIKPCMAVCCKQVEFFR